MKQNILNKFFIGLIMLIFICSSSVRASDQFLKIDGKILNRMSVVYVGKIIQPCNSCVCAYSDCDKWHFKVYPTTNFHVFIGINGTSKQDIQAKHTIVEDWLIKGK